MAMKLLQKAVVDNVEHLTPRIRAVTLKHALRARFQPFQAGAHVTVHLPDGLRRPYSLCGDPGDPTRYRLGVLLEESSRGGSRGIHRLEKGQTLFVSYPANSFALSDSARHHVLVAGGIGITPILSMALSLRAAGASFEVHYYGRGIEHMAFVPEVRDACPKGALHLHPDNQPARALPLNDLLSAPAAGTHVYCCGPEGMLQAFKSASAAFPETHVHLEQFGSAAAAGQRLGDAFELEIANTGEVLQVGEHQTAIDVLRERQIMVDYSCEGGICGECRQELVAGDVDHRDSYLKPEERAHAVMLCMARAKGRMTVRLPKNSPGMDNFRKGADQK